MKTSLKHFAPYGLILALVAALVSGALYIVQHSFNLPLQISLALIVVGIALFALLDPQRLREILAGRQARYSSNALVLSIAFIGILVVINFVAYKNPLRWDLTEDKTHTLSKETIDTLASLKEPVKAEAYFTSRYPSQTAQDLLDSYQYNSSGKFSYEFIDPEQNPVRAQASQVTRDGTIVLKQGERQEQVTYAGEQDMTSALIRLANPGTRAVYFLTGHGEYDPDSTSDKSYSQVKTALTAKNYTVATLNLLATRTIPADALAVIIAGPDKPVSAEETDLLTAYLQNGGSIVYLAEPEIVTQFGDAPDPLAANLQANWGIQFNNDMVIDLNYNPPSVAVSASYGQHVITDKLNNLAVVMPSARSIEQAEPQPAGITTTVLIQTAQNSWAETDMQSLSDNKVNYDSGVDLQGPISLAIAAENTTTGGRVVVVGDSDFASSNNFGQYGNGDFLINAIDWAAKQENLINLTPKQSTQRILVMNNQSTMGLILLGTVFLLPGIVIIGGVAVWIQRRRRG